MQKRPNKCARFPQGLTPTAAKVVQSAWNTFRRGIFTTPRIRAAELCACGNAEASIAYTLQDRCCIPGWEEARCPASGVRGAREPGGFGFTAGNFHRDCEHFLVCENGARERLISEKTCLCRQHQCSVTVLNQKTLPSVQSARQSLPITSNSKHTRATGPPKPRDLHHIR